MTLPTRFRTMIAVLVLLAALVVVFSAVAAERLGDIDRSTTYSRCGDRLTADFMIAVARALDAPPTPSNERDAAVTDIRRSARRLANADRVCADGIPAPLTPTPTT